MALSEVNAPTTERPKHSNIEAENNPTEKQLYEDDRSLKTKKWKLAFHGTPYSYWGMDRGGLGRCGSQGKKGKVVELCLMYKMNKKE